MIVEEKWQEILLTVKEEYELSKVVYESWIKPLEIFRIEGGLQIAGEPLHLLGRSGHNHNGDAEFRRMPF